MELSIDTATRYAGAALSLDGRVIAETAWHSRNNHTAELAPAVDGLLREAKSSARELRGISVVIGPGGFSALRVGLGFAKGLAESLDIPIAPVSALEVEAARHFDGETGPLCPLLEVGRDRVAWCVYERSDGAWRRVATSRSRRSRRWWRLCRAARSTAARGRGTRGNGCGSSRRAPGSSRWSRRRGRWRCWRRWDTRRWRRGSVPERGTLEPNYLRPPSITMPAGGGR